MFAITLEESDLAFIAECVTRADSSALTQTDKAELRRYWRGGLDQWASAPPWESSPGVPADAACPLCRVVTCTYGTAADFTYLLTRVNDAVQFPLGTDTNYLRALVSDLVLCDIREPWPPA